MDKLTIITKGKTIEFPLKDDSWEALNWALIKGADCGFDFCSAILEALTEAKYPDTWKGEKEFIGEYGGSISD